MNQPEIEGWEVPSGHDLGELGSARQGRLDNRREFTDSGAGEDGWGKTGVVVHREVRFEGEGLPVSAVGAGEGPFVFGATQRECQKTVVEEVFGSPGRLVFVEVDGACEELMPVGEELPGDEAGVFEGRSDAEGEIDAFCDVIDDTFGDQDVKPHGRVRGLKGADEGREQRVRDTGGS